MFEGLKSTARLILAVATVAGAACSTPAGKGPQVAPVYNQETGKLEQLVSDRDGDGRTETRAFMDGAVLKRIEIDRNGDGTADRFEFYVAPKSAVSGSPDSAPAVERIEEANGPGPEITRREFYGAGSLERVEEDTDLNGKTDKWEWYERGALARVELDLLGKGIASQRLVYGPGGALIRVETDPEGDGKFVLVPASR